MSEQWTPHNGAESVEKGTIDLHRKYPTAEYYMRLIGNKSSLKWIPPEAVPKQDFDGTRDQLLESLTNGKAQQVYTIGRRSVYCAATLGLGKIAIKESFYPHLGSRLKYRYLKEPKALHEFRIATQFHARGGQTPEMLAAALDQGAFGVRRSLLFMLWRNNAVTLTDYVRNQGGDPGLVFWQNLAKSLVDSASLGLAHGGHSSENILVTVIDDELVFDVIDFSESQLYTQFRAEAFCRDTARIARRLLAEEACSRSTIDQFIHAVATSAKAYDDRPELESDIQAFLTQRINEVNAKAARKKGLS